VLGFMRLRLSLIRHGHELVPELLKERDYRVRPTAATPGHPGGATGAEDWQPVLQQLVREHHQQKRGGEGAGGAMRPDYAGDVIRACQREIKRSEGSVSEQLSALGRRIGEVQRTNQDLVGTLQRQADAQRADDRAVNGTGGDGQQSRAQQQRVLELEERNQRLLDRLLEMEKLHASAAASKAQPGLPPPAPLRVLVRRQVEEFLRLNPVATLRSLYDACDLQGAPNSH
jgi:hypothetical protein